MPIKKLYYFNLDQINHEFIFNSISQYEKVDLIKLEKIEDLFSPINGLAIEYLLLDKNTDANFLRSHKEAFNGALLNTKLLWITSDYIEKSNFDLTKIAGIFKKEQLLPKDASVLKKSSTIYDFIMGDRIETLPKDDSFLPLDLVYLNNVKKSPCDIFLKISDKKYVKIINAMDDFQIEDVIAKYTNKNIKEFYITLNNLSKFKELILKNVFKTTKNIEEPITHQLYVTEAVLVIARDFGINDFIIEGINETFSEIDREFNSSAKLKHFLFQIDTLKGTIIGTHSYLTAVFVSLIGQKVPWFNREVKKNLLTAAILHDLDISNTGLESFEFKSIHEINGLVPNDREVVKNHSHHIANKLAKIDIIASDVVNIISKHHEGAGNDSYPQGLHAPQLSPPNCLFNTAHQFSIELAKLAYDFDKIDQALANARQHYTGNSFKPFLDILQQELGN